MKRQILFLAGFVSAAMILSATAAAGVVPYTDYTWSELDESYLPAPQAFVPSSVVYGHSLGLSAFNQPTDIAAGSDGRLYILDQGNNRIVVLDGSLRLSTVFEGFIHNGNTDGFKGARGVFVDDTSIYIADTDHQRIVILDRVTGSLVTIVPAPQATVLGSGFINKPIRVASDSDHLLYVVSEGTYKGVINLNRQGKFIGFVGTNQITASACDIFWQKFSTRSQRKTMTQFVPQDFSSIDLDSEGFFFCTRFTAENKNLVKRLNPGGEDIIRSLSSIPISGDPRTYNDGSLKGKSSFLDVAAGPYGIYACLDRTRGKIFCYDHDGYLLFTFGTLSEQDGGFDIPTGLVWLGGKSVAVVDRKRGNVTVFSPTAYALAIEKGIQSLNDLQYEAARQAWVQVLEMNNTNELAHMQIGKVYLNAGDYKQALREFSAANNKILYSQALGEYRTEWVYQNVTVIFSILGGIVLLGLCLYWGKRLFVLRSSRPRKTLQSER